MELPSSFTDYTRTLLGSEEYEKLAASLEGEQSASIRLNEDKLPGSSFSFFRSSLEQVPWSAAGCYLDKRLTFTFDPLFHAGCYYVQEASSMFVEQALRQYAAGEPVTMLDLCAAPGGKSTLARSVLPAGSLLVANEVIRNRSQVLAENLTKWGHPGVVVTNSDPADFVPLAAFFDVILADVPCSGEGMFRKDPLSVSEWSEENVEICWQRQRRIISDIWPCLKPGGILIYSTCTYNTKENEENVRWIREEFGAEVLPLETAVGWNITGNLLPDEDFPVYRFLPHRTKGEGFFLAVFRKQGRSGGKTSAQVSSRDSAFAVPGRGDEISGKRSEVLVNRDEHSRGKAAEAFGKKNGGFRDKGRKPREKGAGASEVSKEQLSALRRWLVDSDDYEFILNGNRVSAFPKEHLAGLSALRSSLRIVQAGVDVAELKGKDRVPAHGLAMSRALNPDAFAREEIGYEQAIGYLRKEAVALPEAAPRGIVLLTYRQVPLGFVKNVGNRANNLYPREWRIRSGYTPEELLPLFHAV